MFPNTYNHMSNCHVTEFIFKSTRWHFADEYRTLTNTILRWSSLFSTFTFLIWKFLQLLMNLISGESDLWVVSHLWMDWRSSPRQIFSHSYSSQRGFKSIMIFKWEIVQVARCTRQMQWRGPVIECLWSSSTRWQCGSGWRHQWWDDFVNKK